MPRLVLVLLDLDAKLCVWTYGWFCACIYVECYGPRFGTLINGYGLMYVYVNVNLHVFPLLAEKDICI